MLFSCHAHVIAMWFPQQLLNNCMESYQQWGSPTLLTKLWGPPHSLLQCVGAHHSSCQCAHQTGMSLPRHAHVIVMWFPSQLLSNSIESYQQWGLPHTTYQALGPPPFSAPVCGGPPLFLPMRASNRNVIFLPCACDRDVVSFAIA
jgi:hypothetical protein